VDDVELNRILYIIYLRAQKFVLDENRKANEISKFRILGEKTKFEILDEKRPADRKKCQNVM